MQRHPRLSVLTLEDRCTPATAIGGGNVDTGYAVTAGGGFVYVAGEAGAADFDPGLSSNDNDVPVGSLFVAKYAESGGAPVWVRTVSSGSAFLSGRGIAVDGSGNVYTTGRYSGTADFDPGPGVQTRNGFADSAFVWKLDADGNFGYASLFVPTTVNSGSTIGHGIAVDGAGQVVVTGQLNGSVDFDPGAGVATRVSAGQIDVFVAKLTAAGDFVYADRYGTGGFGDDLGYGVALDSAANAYVTGSAFEADFDPGAGESVVAGGFLLKLTPGGAFAFAKSVAESSPAGYGVGLGVDVDGADNIYVTGFFGGNIDFDPGPGVLNLTVYGGDDGFVSKLDTSGNVQYARSFGGTNHDRGYDIAVTAGGEVAVTGWFRGTADFDPGVGTASRTSNGDTDAFVLLLNATGGFVSAEAYGAAESDRGNGIAFGASATPFATGLFNGTVDFDATAGTQNLVEVANGDAFVTGLAGGSAHPVPFTVTPTNPTVPEFRPAGQLATTLTGTSPFAAAYSFALVAGSGSADNAAFALNAASVLTARPLDAGAQAVYSIRVRTTDATGHFAERVFTITATDTASLTLTNRTLAVAGGGGNDRYSFSAGADAHILTLNDVTFAVRAADVDQVFFDGAAGADTAALTVRGTGNALSIWPAAALLNGTAYSAVALAELVTGYGGATDGAYLIDAAGNDVFVGAQTYAYLQGSGYHSAAVGFGGVTAYASGGTDAAYLTDSPGNDVYSAAPTYAFLTGAGFWNTANGFDGVTAYASGGTDAAYLTGSAGVDVFSGQPTYAFLQGAGFWNTANGFDGVNAYGGGGADAAYLSDGPGNDTFYGTGTYASLSGPGFFVGVEGFAGVSVFGNGGGTNSKIVGTVSYWLGFAGSWV